MQGEMVNPNGKPKKITRVREQHLRFTVNIHATPGNLHADPCQNCSIAEKLMQTTASAGGIELTSASVSKDWRSTLLISQITA